MEGSIECFDTLICSGARRLTGYQRRLFMAEVTTELCKGSARQAERRFGWGRETVLKGLHESRQGIRCLENFAARGRLRSEEKDPQLAANIRAIVEPHTYADPQLKSSRRYTNLSAAEVREALIATGHPSEKLPSERTLRDILNRMNYRLKRIQKGKPLKKTKLHFPRSRVARQASRGVTRPFQMRRLSPHAVVGRPQTHAKESRGWRRNGCRHRSSSGSPPWPERSTPASRCGSSHSAPGCSSPAAAAPSPVGCAPVARARLQALLLPARQRRTQGPGDRRGVAPHPP